LRKVFDPDGLGLDFGYLGADAENPALVAGLSLISKLSLSRVLGVDIA
jgi:hypothetical protein